MAITFGGPTTELPTRLVVRDNLMGGGQYGVSSGPGLATNTALATFSRLAAGAANVLILVPGNQAGYPTGTLFATSLNAVGFVNAAALDFHLVDERASLEGDRRPRSGRRHRCGQRGNRWRDRAVSAEGYAGQLNESGRGAITATRPLCIGCSPESTTRVNMW